MIEGHADLYKGPVETIIFSYFIYQSMGLSGLAGVFLILSFIPIQVWLNKKMGECSEAVWAAKDKRLQFVSEIINGIQIVKMYGWENAFVKMMEKIRGKEMEGLEKSWLIYAILMVLAIASKVSVFLSIIAYILAGNSLTSENVFMLSIYYSQLNNSMVHYWPMVLRATSDGLLAIQRLEEFLVEGREEFSQIKPKAKRSSNNSKKFKQIGSLELSNASGSWTSDIGQKCVGIDEVNLKIQPGTLNIVIGNVGSGKSSLLQAISAELELDEGKVEFNGQISYATQETWLFNDTIRNNILFNETFDEVRYEKVIKACALKRDLGTFVQGDDTIVAERGISLSGGQKARINLARAVYKNADIYLLDDVLSSVDVHVGNFLNFSFYLQILKHAPL